MDDSLSREPHLSSALEAGQIGVWTWAAAAGCAHFDGRARKILGRMSAEPLTVDGLIALAHSDDRAELRAQWELALDPCGTGDILIEFRVIQQDSGIERWVATRGKVVFENGQPHHAAGILRDISDQRYHQARFTGIVAIAADAIISIDGLHRITLFNDGAERIFGYARAELLGQPLDILLPYRFREGHRAHIGQFGDSATAARRMGERAEIYGRRKNGDDFPAEASISHLEIGSERLYTVVLRDITEHKRAEDLLAESNSLLEARVKERTRALNAEMQRREATQAQLVRTQRMQAFGQLTGGVAHDFNNLLTVITGNLELLEMRLKDEKDRTLVKRAHDAAEMGARLTARLLTFAGRRQYETARLNLNSLIKGMVDLLGRTLGEPVTLETRFDPQVWTITADPSEVENAVLNLSINARDAMLRGGRLVIETANVPVEAGMIGSLDTLAAGDYVRLSVLDTGSGMPPEVLAHAYEPFFTTKQPGKGTGLGLSTIYGFAHELGGTVTIDSAVGHGTTVSIYLPRSEAPALAAAAQHPAAVAPTATGETVLLVEDNAEVRLVTRGRLADLGYRVVEAKSGPDAIAELQSAKDIDIVFSDVVMAGGMSGFDVAQWVRSNRPGLKLLLTSGFADEALRAQTGDVADLKVLRKPYSRGELARALRALDG